MLISIGVWWLFGIAGSFMMYLGVKDDGEGFDKNDFLFLSLLSLTGPCMLCLGIPFLSLYIRSLFK